MQLYTVYTIDLREEDWFLGLKSHTSALWDSGQVTLKIGYLLSLTPT